MAPFPVVLHSVLVAHVRRARDRIRELSGWNLLRHARALGLADSGRFDRRLPPLEHVLAGPDGCRAAIYSPAQGRSCQGIDRPHARLALGGDRTMSAGMSTFWVLVAWAIPWIIAL